MAVARAPVSGSRMTGTMVALIVFVCLTVASLTLAIVMLTYKSQLEADAAAARDQAAKATRDKSEMQQQVGEIARHVTGQNTYELPAITAAIDKVVGEKAPIWKDPAIVAARIGPDVAVVDVLGRLYTQFQNQAALLAKTLEERKQLVDQLAATNQNAEKQAKEFQAKMTDAQNTIARLEQENTAHQQAWNQQLEELKKQQEKSSADARTTLARERQTHEQLEKQIQQRTEHETQLAEKLSRFQPGAKVTATDIADGEVVRVVLVDKLVYIGLGRRDRITPGMPFTVYSRPRSPGGADVHEKATIEVTNVFDTTAQCKITSSKTGDPIVTGDLVANLIYDRDKRYRFAVAGDFDLDFDSRIDPDGVNGQNVARLIQRWGGEVVNTVDTSVDFVVLGSPPAAPPPLAAGATEEAKQRAADQAKRRQDFDTMRAEAKSLSIPVLTRTQFLHFIGMQVPARVPEDQLAAQ